MNRLSKVILSTLAALVTLAVLVMVGVNLYLQSPGTQARIQAAVSKALRVPVTFTSTSVSIGGQLKIAGIVIPDGEHKFLEASAFTANYRSAGLLRGRLEIYGMSVERPRIVWQQNRDGDWVVPRLPEDAKTKAAEKPAERKVEPPGAGDGDRKRGIEVVVEGFQIHNGSVELLDRKGRVVAGFQGVNVRYTTLTSEKMEGSVHIERLNWGKDLTFENFRTPFLYVGREISLPDLNATLAGGTVTGKFSMKTDGKKPPFTLNLAFDRIDAGLLSTQMHSALGKATGAIGGTLELHGNARDLEDMEGTGSLLVRDGRVQQLELFEAIGEVLQIKELADLKLKEGRANFRIGEERAHLDELSLEAADLRLSAQGEVRFDGRIKLAAKLSIDESLRKHLPGLIRGNFEEEEDRGRHAITFDITGKEFRMRTNLLDRIVGKKVTSQFDDLLTSLFGKKKDKKDEGEEAKDEKKKDAAPAPDAAPPARPQPVPPAPAPGEPPRVP